MAFDLSKTAYGANAPVSKLDRIQLIPVGLIQTNERNFYAVEGIQELADSIATVGLLDPVRVMAIPGSPTSPYRYRLISGHRRMRAYFNLYTRGGEGYLQYASIPAIVMEDMDDLTETFALVTANSTARELSYAEKCRQEAELRRILTAWREAGKEIPKNLGQYIADQIGTSRNEVSRMHSVNEHLIPEARAQLEAGRLTAQQAYDLSRRSEADQLAAVSKLDTSTKAAPAEPAKAATPPEDPKPLISRTMWAGFEELLPELLRRIPTLGAITSRSDGITELKAMLKARGSFGRPGGQPGPWLTAVDSTLGISYGHGLEYFTPSLLWDAMSILALRRCRDMDAHGETSPAAPVSNLDTAPSPAGTGWHREDPTEDGRYVCLYRGAGDTDEVVRADFLDWDGGAWTRYEHDVAGVFTIITWTEVPDHE